LGANGDFASINLFAYCGNNPITREDIGGAFWETALDILSLGLSVKDVIANPTDVWAWASLAADVVSLAVPFATGGGAIVNAATKADDVVDVAQDMAKTTVKNLNFDSTENLFKHFADHNSQFGDLFSSADEYLNGANYVINNGQFVPELNGYIRFLGTGGKANYAFVGLKNAGKNISTFHVKSVEKLVEIPSLGFFY